MSPMPLNAAGLPIDFEPEYKRVQQTNDHDCLFAVFAMVAGLSIGQVRAMAVAHDRIPEHGCFNPVDDGSLAALLAGLNGWVATIWKECSTTYQLPDLAILLIDVGTFDGRHVLFERQRNHGGQPNVEAITDPGFWIAAELRVRSISDHELSWYIGLHPMDRNSDY